MGIIATKIRKAINNNKLNPEILGERKWYNYFIVVTELVWARNNHDGYQIEFYSEQYGNHLSTIIL